MTKNIQKKSILLISTADWEAPLRTNKQYMAEELAKEFGVFYLESMPHRNPKLNILDLHKIFQRLIKVKYQRRTNIENIEIVSPLLLPVFSENFRPLIDRVNDSLLKYQLKSILNEIDLIWSFTPLLNRLEELEVPIVYHSVDLIHEVPNNYRKFILDSERKMTLFSDLHVIASSSGVKAHLSEIGFERISLWTNVGKKQSNIINDCSGRKNEVVFVGNLLDFKLDLELINLLLKTFPETKFNFVGPGNHIDKIKREKNVIFHGLLSPSQANEVMNRCKVGIIPYTINAYTLGVLPLKLFEYLQAGLIVLSTELPSVIELGFDPGLVVVSESHTIFTKNLNEILKGTFKINEAKDLGDIHSWESRGIQARNLASRLLRKSK
jgi:teichuronic acid biosynthesis glycosyltransferase TuaH